MDELLLRLVRDEGAEAVLNLAAGLDARPWRMALPAGLRWYDADLPGMLAYKREMLAGETPVCAYEGHEVDLVHRPARCALLAEVAAAHRRVVVITEGLLVYLEAAQVAELAADLAACGPLRWWITDLGSPGLLKMMERTWAPKLRASGAPMKFGPAEGTRFFEPHGWREAEYRSTWFESLRLKRSVPLAGLWSLLGRFSSPARREEMRRFSGIVRLERLARGAPDGVAGGGGSPPA
jgi:methyltransferase (TIGR00027 family)